LLDAPKPSRRCLSIDDERRRVVGSLELLALAGCLGGTDAGETSTDEPSETGSPTTDPTEEPTPTDGPESPSSEASTPSQPPAGPECSRGT
jgi:hypothetical protein